MKQAGEGRSRLDDVIDAALDLLAREGEAGLGFNRVARELGVKPPSLYNHVANDADLRRRVALRGWQSFGDAAEAAVAGARGAGALRRFADALRAFARAHPGLFDVMRHTSLDPADPLVVPVQARLLTLFDAPLARLGVPPRARIHAVRALRAAIEGFVALERDGQLRLSADADESFRFLLDTLLSGLTYGTGDTRPGSNPAKGRAKKDRSQ